MKHIYLENFANNFNDSSIVSYKCLMLVVKPFKLVIFFGLFVIYISLIWVEILYLRFHSQELDLNVSVKQGRFVWIIL